MKERDFGGLIVRHRKSAVFFERQADLNNTKMYAPYIQWDPGKETIRGEEIPHFERCELDIRHYFNEARLKDFYAYLKEIANEAWVNFEPKEADSMATDYESYWDKDFQNEGNLSLRKGHLYFLYFNAPFQPATKNGIVRLYKFNKRKFESFIYDLRKALEGEPNAI